MVVIAYRELLSAVHMVAKKVAKQTQCENSHHSNIGSQTVIPVCTISINSITSACSGNSTTTRRLRFTKPLFCFHVRGVMPEDVLGKNARWTADIRYEKSRLNGAIRRSMRRQVSDPNWGNLLHCFPPFTCSQNQVIQLASRLIPGAFDIPTFGARNVPKIWN